MTEAGVMVDAVEDLMIGVMIGATGVAVAVAVEAGSTEVVAAMKAGAVVEVAVAAEDISNSRGSNNTLPSLLSTPLCIFLHFSRSLLRVPLLSPHLFWICCSATHSFITPSLRREGDWDCPKCQRQVSVVIACVFMFCRGRSNRAIPTPRLTAGVCFEKRMLQMRHSKTWRLWRREWRWRWRWRWRISPATSTGVPLSRRLEPCSTWLEV